MIFTEVKRRFSVSAVDVANGDVVTFDQTNTVIEDLPQAALSSSSVPGVFPPQHFHGMTLMDGGTVWNVDPWSAIEQCLEVVDNVEDIIVDIAICDPYELPTESELGRNSFYEFFRGRKISSFYTNADAIANAKRAYPGVDWRHLFLEEDKLSGPSELDFRNETTWPY